VRKELSWREKSVFLIGDLISCLLKMLQIEIFFFFNRRFLLSPSICKLLFHVLRIKDTNATCMGCIGVEAL
jgi:hypothetical protein